MDPFIIILVLAFGAMWLMTSRTRKQQRKAGDFRANLEVGNEVMTGSGLFGTIVDIDGDTITLESTPGNESRWIRAAIAKLVEPTPFDEAAEDEEFEEDDDEEFDDESELDADDHAAEDDEEYDVDELDVDELEVDDAERDPADAADDHPTDDDAIVVPDDLSTLSESGKDDDTDKK